MQAAISSLQWPKVVIAWVVIAVTIFLTHGPHLLQSFGREHWEDALFFQHIQNHVNSLPDCLSQPLWPGLYRPLTTNCYYFLVDRMTEQRIEWLHTVNILLYSINGLLLFRMGQRFMPRWWALAPALLFVSRFAHSEVVTNSVEFQALLSVFFSLLALELFWHGDVSGRPHLWVLSCVALSLALLSKESAAVVPAILLSYSWLFNQHNSLVGHANWRWRLAPWLVVILWAFLFVLIFRSLSHYAPTGFTYTTSATTILQNYAAYLLSFSNLLTYPMENVVMSPRVMQLVHAPIVLVLLLVSIGLALLVAAHKWRAAGLDAAETANSVEPWPTLLFGFVFFLIATSPFVLFQDRLFMRYGYFGHAGLSLAGGVLIQVGVQSLVAQMRVLPRIWLRIGKLSPEQ